MTKFLSRDEILKGGKSDNCKGDGVGLQFYLFIYLFIYLFLYLCIFIY